MIACFVIVAMLSAIIGGLSGSAWAQAGPVYVINDVAVDETSESAAAARDVALLNGQAAAFRRLIARIVPRTRQGAVEDPDRDTLAALVSGIELEGEKTSPVRYLARLTVRFNPAGVRQYLKLRGIQFAETRSKPLVVLPTYRAQATLQLWDRGNAWLKAWASLPPDDSLISLVVPKGDTRDFATISPEQALSGADDRIRALADRYKADGSLLAAATLRRDDAAGTRILEVSMSRFGTGGAERTFVRNFTSDIQTPVSVLLATAAARSRAELEESWKIDNLLRFGEQGNLMAIAPLQGLQDLVALKRTLGKIAAIEKIEMVFLALSEARFRIYYLGDPEQLALALAQRDLVLEQGSVHWRLTVRGAELEQTNAASSGNNDPSSFKSTTGVK
jgi:hypothetical protein